MKKLLKNQKLVVFFLLLLAMVVGTAVVFAASVTIDHFGNVSQQINTTSGTVSDSTLDNQSIGGERDFELTWLTGSSVRLAANAGVPPSDNLSFSSDTSTQGRATVTFDGIDGAPTVLAPQGLCNPTCADLTDSGANTALRIRVTENDLATTVDFRLYNGTTGNVNDYIQYSLALPGGITPGNAVDFVMPFASFVANGAGANANDVGAIQIFFNRVTATTAVDVAFHIVEATGLTMDLGDLPDVYGTLITSDGARHQLTTGLRLGGIRDAEIDGSPSASANLDNTNDLNDEEGVVRNNTLIGPWNPTNGGVVEITVAGCVGACRINGWIDWNNNGSFGDTDENVVVNQLVSNGVSIQTFPIPASFPSVNQNVYARFRVCQNTGTTCNTPTGLALNGEVEDYYWQFTPTAVFLESFTPAANSTLPVIGFVGFLALAIVSLGAIIVRREQKKA